MYLHRAHDHAGAHPYRILLGEVRRKLMNTRKKMEEMLNGATGEQSCAPGMMKGRCSRCVCIAFSYSARSWIHARNTEERLSEAMVRGSCASGLMCGWAVVHSLCVL